MILPPRIRVFDANPFFLAWHEGSRGRAKALLLAAGLASDMQFARVLRRLARSEAREARMWFRQIAYAESERRAAEAA